MAVNLDYIKDNIDNKRFIIVNTEKSSADDRVLVIKCSIFFQKGFIKRYLKDSFDVDVRTIRVICNKRKKIVFRGKKGYIGESKKFMVRLF